jgi:hypothetical protein
VGASAATGIPAHWCPHGPRTRAQAIRRHWHSERNGHTADSQRRIVALREAALRAARGVRVTVYCVLYMLLLSASVACSVRAACCIPSPGPTPRRRGAGAGRRLYRGDPAAASASAGPCLGHRGRHAPLSEAPAPRAGGPGHKTLDGTGALQGPRGAKPEAAPPVRVKASSNAPDIGPGPQAGAPPPHARRMSAPPVVPQ